MIINPVDKSNYFKGLLVLVGKGKDITQNESNLIKKIGNILGFEHDFVDNVIKNFFKNKYIDEDPPAFTNYDFAEIFIRDGMRMSLTENSMSLNQIKWLTETALKNNLSKQWFFIELENILDSFNSDFEFYFEIQKYLNHMYDESSFIY